MCKGVIIVMLAAGLAATSGCLVKAKSTTTRSGNYVSTNTISLIEPGQTRASWVLATLGEPSSRTDVDAIRQLWTYQYTETKDSAGYVFLIFGGRDRKVTEGKVFVEVEDGVVMRVWRD